MPEQSTEIDFAINNEKCKRCENLVNVDQIDPNYEGPLATYTNGKCCTLDCIDIPKDYE